MDPISSPKTPPKNATHTHKAQKPTHTDEQNPLAAEVLDNIDRLVDNVDAVQALLDIVRAAIDQNNSHIAEEVALFSHLRRLEGELRTTPMTAEERQAARATVAEADTNIRASIVLLLERRRHLGEVFALLLAARAVAFARSRAHLIPGVLLTAAAVVVYASLWGGVVPGFRSLVRVFALVTCFLFGGNLMRL
ncbi:hypothetical protein E2562_021472 [Oryza meyeriana var. granulata]|uniref:Transmembrane protein n=1 Tax=Oryza meyeriana var. granulata TaxID=110450 RepID=A0A6G1DZ56_9ORYZ|nr:hypothetical protein E2562_021472 [Oryza meyeriana var. granulata]